MNSGFLLLFYFTKICMSKQVIVYNLFTKLQIDFQIHDSNKKQQHILMLNAWFCNYISKWEEFISIQKQDNDFRFCVYPHTPYIRYVHFNECVKSGTVECSAELIKFSIQKKKLWINKIRKLIWADPK